MTITQDYLQAQRDYEKLCSIHGGQPCDITGGFVEGDVLWGKLMKNPCKKEALSIYEDIIEYSFDVGFGENLGEYLEIDNPEVREIYIRHGLIDEDE